ncbi:MAG: hypothetical protein IIW01_11180, partial [Thermoguttaceae bacterium]|nr:hypothetical protein [Thermoguttaceae bacterium]
APAPPAAPAPAPAAPAPAAPAPAPETPPAAPAPAPPTPEEQAAALRQIGVTSAEQVPVPSENPAAAVQMVADVKEALANPTPPPPAPSEPIKIDFDPERSYSRLLYPGVAARVGLTDMQTARVNELMLERSQKLAKSALRARNKSRFRAKIRRPPLKWSPT